MISTLDNTIDIRQEFKSLFEYSLDFLFIYDFEGRIIDFNEIALKALEYSKEELLKMTIFDFVIEEEIDQALEGLQVFKDKGRTMSYDIFKIKKKNGGYIYLELSGIPFKLKNNKPAVLGIGHDITSLKETEEDLKISEKKYRSLFDESPIGIMLFDLKGNLIDRNLAIVKVFPEYLGINLAGKNYKQILAFFINSEQLMKVFMERLKALRQGESLEPFEFFIDTKDRRRVWISWQSSIVKINNETFIQVLLQNITERKEAEQNLQVLFNNSTSGIAYHRIVYDTKKNPIDYVITDVNPKYEKILPFKKKDVINKKATELYQIESAPYIDIYSKVAATQVSTSFEAYFPPLDKHFKISVISPKKGEFITVFDDLSEQKKAEEVVKLERDKLQAMMDGLTSAEIGIDIVDINYNILFQNQFLKDRFGDISTEYCYKKYMELSQPCEFCPMDKAIKNNRVESIELIGKDGKGYELISAPLTNPDGTIDKVIEVVLDITDRKRADQKLKESEEKFRNIAEQNFLGITIIQDDVISYANQAILDIFGYSLEEVKKWGPLEYLKIFLPKDREFIKSQERNRKEGYDREIHNYQVQFIKKNGEIGWLDLFSNSIEYKGKLGAMVTVIDITDKMKAEQNLKESEEKFRIITEQSFMGIAIMQDNEIKYANEALAKITEYSIEEWLEMPVEYVGEKIVHHDDLPAEMVRIRERRQFGEDGVTPYSSYRIFTKSGELRWIEDYTKVILFQGKEALLSIFMDITEKKEAEKFREKSEKKYRHLFENAPFVIGLIDMEGKIIDFNETVNNLFPRYKKQDLLGKDIFEWISTNNKEKTPLFRKVLEDIGRGEIKNSFELQINRATGEKIWINVHFSLMNIEDENVIQVILQNITEKKEAEKLIIEENKKLLELDEIRKEMITRISHELKTPLTSIYGAIQILSESLRDQMSDNVLKFVDVIHRGSIRFKKLIENLLDISRMDSRKLELNTQQEDLSEIVNECVNEMIYLANNRELTINLNLPHELFFELDKLRMEQAITNLISNAIKNTPMNGLISISLLDYKEYVDIEIEDTGVGLTPEEKLKLFEKFGKIERYGMDLDVDIEGIGLGLFISKEIVELHNGKILVESEGRNMGTIFTIRLFKN